MSIIWTTVDRPGYFGKKRDELIEGFDRRHGAGGWRIAWEWGKEVIERPEALQLYEDAYYEHFKSNPNLLGWLTTKFSNVYDNAPSNVDSGFSYHVQETPNAHLHDIAIRRAVLRVGESFKGHELLEVQSGNPEGKILSPCNIPFHFPYRIYQGQTKYQGESRDFKTNPPWWIVRGVPNSVEMFYQQNKVLQVME